MKNKIYYILVILICAMCLHTFSPLQVVDAEEYNPVVTLATVEEGEESPVEPPVEPSLEEKVYTDFKEGGYELNNSSDIQDKNLYSALMQIARQTIKEKYPDYNTQNETTLWTTMLKSVETITIKDMDIENLSGIEKMRFDNLKSLNIINNKIVSLPDNFFDRMGNLETLNLACNKITKVTFPSNSKIANINLSSNALTSANFSQLTSANLNINVANNSITSIKNIGLPTRYDSIKVNIINNNITDLTDEYFNDPKVQLFVGLQGVVSANENVTIDTSTDLYFYKTNLNNVYVKIYKVGTLSDELVRTISDSDVENNVLTLKFGVGKYYAEYLDDSGALYVSGDSDKNLYKSYKFSVIPTVCTIKYEFKGKIYDTFDNKVTGKVKVLLSCEDGGKIYYKVGNSDWIEGNEINCDKGGSYSIITKVVIDGVESKEKSTLVKTSLNVIIPDIVMLILILLFTLAIFVVIVPLVSRKWFRK